MAGWASGLAQGGVGAVRGFKDMYQFMAAMQDRERSLEAEKMFGSTLRDMYAPAPQPAPGASTGMPTNAPMRPPMQIPGAQPMPQAMPPQAPMQAPMRSPMQPPMGQPPAPPPYSQVPQGGGQMPVQRAMLSPPPAGGGGMPQAPMRSPMSQPPGGPGMPQAPMRGGPGAMGSEFETMPTQPQQQLPTNLDWRTLMTKLAEKNPGADPATLARVVDRAMPMMNSQSQMEWRELSGKIRALEQERKTTQGDRSLDIREDNAETSKGRLAETRRMHDVRIKKISTDIDRVGREAKLPPEVKAQLEVFRDFYKSTATSVRVAQTNLQRAQYEGKPENIATAQEDVKEAEAAMQAAEQRVMQFVTKIAPKAKLDFSAPAEGKLGAGGSFAPGSSVSEPETNENGEQIVTTKLGTKAQVGMEEPEPQVASGPAASASALDSGAARPPDTVSARPPPAGGKTYPMPPQTPAGMAMLVPNRRYTMPEYPGVVYVWDGKAMRKVKSGGGSK